VGDSSKVSFLQDFWCEVLPIKGAFLELFSIACLRDASVEDNLQFLIALLSGTLISLERIMIGS
jgi:hypothetical protein